MSRVYAVLGIVVKISDRRVEGPVSLISDHLRKTISIRKSFYRHHASSEHVARGIFLEIVLKTSDRSVERLTL
jgi:hypothetical protein